MKVLKYSIDYDGYYGGSMQGYCLLPLEIKDLYIEGFAEEGSYDDAVYLGKIEGKHSHVETDLIVEIIDLEDLNIKEINELINGSDVGTFESFFEGQEESHFEYLEDEENEEQKELLARRKAFEEKYNISSENSWSIMSSLASDAFVEALKEKYQVELVTFFIKKEDEAKFRMVMNDYELEIFE